MQTTFHFVCCLLIVLLVQWNAGGNKHHCEHTEADPFDFRSGFGTFCCVNGCERVIHEYQIKHYCNILKQMDFLLLNTHKKKTTTLSEWEKWYRSPHDNMCHQKYSSDPKTKKKYHTSWRCSEWAMGKRQLRKIRRVVWNVNRSKIRFSICMNDIQLSIYMPRDVCVCVYVCELATA